jgi:aspartyl-tRNA(Asn)/glutamyl-tRNA(Gln) amidotransferase subunit C
MSLSRSDVERIAHLARLRISEAEAEGYAGSLSRILAFVEQLSAADTRDVLPLAHPLAGERQRLRADVVDERDRHARLQENAPRVEADLYIVPKVIE